MNIINLDLLTFYLFKRQRHLRKKLHFVAEYKMKLTRKIKERRHKVKCEPK